MAASGPAAKDVSEDPIVLVVDDDNLVRRSIEDLLQSAGYRSMGFSSASDFLQHELPDTLRCLVVDVRLPRLSGLDLQAELSRRGDNIPIVFMTGHGDIPMSVKAMKAGAIDFLAKPFRDQDMLDAVAAALVADQARRDMADALQSLRARFAILSDRERQVMAGVVEGLLNKQIAGDLGLSEITVKLHRSSLMKKMEARTLAQLVRMAETLERNNSAT
jgi:FixJ family two-component response regulator